MAKIIEVDTGAGVSVMQEKFYTELKRGKEKLLELFKTIKGEKKVIKKQWMIPVRINSEIYDLKFLLVKGIQ